MQKAGFAFLAAAFVVLVVFVGDILTSGEARHEYDAERNNVRDVERFAPDKDDPGLRPKENPLDFDIKDEEIFTSFESDLLHQGADYTYTVREGDVIDDLARKYLGDNTLKSILYDRNPHLVRGLRLEPGTRILIPFSERR